jgi:type VI secretion system secreted protein VgrG
VDGILNKSPTMQKDWKDLQAKGWKIREGEAGKGTYADRDRKTIVVDPNDKANPAVVAQSIAHEAGPRRIHALAQGHRRRGDQGPVRPGNLKRNLDDEGGANFENARVRDEVKQNGGPDIGSRAPSKTGIRPSTTTTRRADQRGRGQDPHGRPVR